MKKIISVAIFLLVFTNAIFAFDDKFVFGVKTLFSGSYTDIHIEKNDLQKMGADYLKGSVGFIMAGEANLAYIFDSINYFHRKSKYAFGGLGLGFFLGVGQGFAGEISGNSGTDIFVNVMYTPVITLGFDLKAYFLNNRLITYFGLGTRVIADTTPTYDMYNNGDPNNATLKKMDGVGTIIVTGDMMKKMNAFGFLVRTGMEYVQPILPTTELVIGGYLSYCVYKPKYIAMPKAVEEGAAANGFNAKTTPLNSFYLNSFNFGLSVGVNFRVNQPNIGRKESL